MQSFTTAPMGEVDGAMLDDGTVIHWPPHLADRFPAFVARGDRIRRGRMETGPAGDTHLEVQTVTNLRTNASAENDGPSASATGPRRRPPPPPLAPAGGTPPASAMRKRPREGAEHDHGPDGRGGRGGTG